MQPNWPGAILVIAVFGCAVLPAAASSDEEPEPDLFTLSLSDLMDIEVSAPTRTRQSLVNVPAAVTVFTRTELSKMGIDFLYELLSYVPGYQTTRDNDYSGSYFYSARGSDTGQDTTAILLLVDGIPRQEIRTASASALSGLMSLDRIERIEVMRGPGSALYGSGAFLGVINIITVQGNNQFKAQIGEPDRQQLNAQISQQFGAVKLDAYLSHYSDKGQSYRLDDRFGNDLQTTTDPQQIGDYALSLSLGNTRLSIERSKLNTDDYYSIAVIDNDFNHHQHVLNQIALEQTFDWLQVSSEFRLAYRENTLDYWAVGTPPGALSSVSQPSSSDPLQGHVHDYTDALLVQWLNDWRINDRNSLQFGAEHQHESLQESWIRSNFDAHAVAVGNFPVAYSPDGDIYSEYLELSDRDILGLYGQWQSEWGTSTHLTLGARYDRYQDVDENLSLRLALVQQLTDNQYLKLIYGEAFRAPSLVQLATRETLLVAPNPDLQAETIHSSELVWMLQRSRYSFSASGFYNIIDDHINSSGFIGTRRANVNEDRDYSGGIELESSLQLSRGWLVRAAFTEFLRLPAAAFQNSERLASLIANYQRDNWWFNLSGYYNSQRHMPGPDHINIDGFTQFNAKLGCQLDNNITLDFQIKNLTDATVASAPQVLEISTPLTYRGREASVGFTLDF